jgi:hypothetical protein
MWLEYSNTVSKIHSIFESFIYSLLVVNSVAGDEKLLDQNMAFLIH